MKVGDLTVGKCKTHFEMEQVCANALNVVLDTSILNKQVTHVYGLPSSRGIIPGMVDASSVRFVVCISAALCVGFHL